MAATRANVEFAKRIGLDRVGNDYVYGGNWSPTDKGRGTDCSGLCIDILDAAVNGPAMAWSRHGMSTESWRPVDVGQRGPFGTICVASPADFPPDAVVKLAIHHGPGGGANSHMWCEVDGIRLESNGSDGCVTGPRARSVYDQRYANDWHYLPGPITDGAAGPDPVSVLAQATGLSLERAAQVLPALRDGLIAAECVNVNRIAMALAQWGHESDNFQTTTEYASGDAYDTRTDLGNTPEVDGDGALYKGRTWGQITGKGHYRGFSQWAFERALVPTPRYFVDNPLELSDLKWAAIGAAWYWVEERPDINELADRRDLVAVTHRINGGENGLYTPGGRRDRFNRALAVGDALLTLTQTGDDMASVPQHEWADVHRELTQKHRSRSPLRHLGEGEIDTWAGIDLNDDGNDHVVATILLASIGNPRDLALLAEVASAAGDDKWPDRQEDALLARRILTYIANTNPTVLLAADPARLQRIIAEKGTAA